MSHLRRPQRPCRSGTTVGLILWALSAASVATLTLAPHTAVAQVVDPSIDPLLVKLVDPIVRAHPSALQGGHQVDAATQSLAGARKGRLPTPSVTATAGDGVRSTDMRLTRHLFDWGRVEANISASEHRLQATQAESAALVRSLAGNAFNAWRDWALAQQRERVYAGASERLARYDAGARARHTAGVGSDADLALLRSRMAQLAVERVANASMGQSARFRLTSMGADLDAGRGLLQAAAESVKPPPLEAAMSAAERHSPTLARLASESAAAGDDALALAAQSRPTVNVAVAHQRSHMGGTRSNDTRLLLTLEYAPGAGLASREAASASRARARALDAERAAGVLELRSAVVGELESLASLVERAPNDASAVQANLSVLQSFERQFTAGRRSWLDVLNADRELMQAELQLATVRTELVAAHARLALLTGTLPVPGASHER